MHKLGVAFHFLYNIYVNKYQENLNVFQAWARRKIYFE